MAEHRSGRPQAKISGQTVAEHRVRAADDLRIHPNTLRYRVRRAEEILGMSVDDPDSLPEELQVVGGP